MNPSVLKIPVSKRNLIQSKEDDFYFSDSDGDAEYIPNNEDLSSSSDNSDENDEDEIRCKQKKMCI
ncbi:hypothetical protein HHI36_003531 [Cryptolaemus montrouzieri]|uniref:Uncharacterized protein n=1 Tax=Cryptolaemus montrouzieri TaxID=559131 RepID=A0ABD2PE70_9CUCU